jgi:hypothetical protein
VFEFSLSKLLLLDYTFSPMELLEVLITLPLRKQTYLRVLRELSVPTTADTIAENKTFTIVSGTASATGTINDNDAAPTVATITPAAATRKSCCLNSA